MAVYGVAIGRHTRRGTEVLQTQFVESEMREYDIKKHYEDQYKGFEIVLTKALKLDTLVAPPATPAPVATPAITKIQYIHNKKVTLTEEELALYTTYVEKDEASRDAKRALRSAIIRRLKELPWAYAIAEDEVKLDPYRVGERVEIARIQLQDDVFIQYESDLGAQDE